MCVFFLKRGAHRLIRGLFDSKVDMVCMIDIVGSHSRPWQIFEYAPGFGLFAASRPKSMGASLLRKPRLVRIFKQMNFLIALMEEPDDDMTLIVPLFDEFMMLSMLEFQKKAGEITSPAKEILFSADQELNSKPCALKRKMNSHSSPLVNGYKCFIHCERILRCPWRVDITPAPAIGQIRRIGYGDVFRTSLVEKIPLFLRQTIIFSPRTNKFSAFCSEYIIFWGEIASICIFPIERF